MCHDAMSHSAVKVVIALARASATRDIIVGRKLAEIAGRTSWATGDDVEPAGTGPRTKRRTLLELAALAADNACL